jgi:nitroreductase
MEDAMSQILEAIFQRRAVKVFDPVEITKELRERILDAARAAPSSFNIQPYRFYWVQNAPMKKVTAKLCMGQKPAETASALVVAVADICSWQSTTRAHLQWMRETGRNEKEVREQEKRSKLAKWFFMQGWFGSLGAVKWLLLRTINLWRIIGMAPVSRQGLFKWAVKSTSLACENLMIAAETLGLNTCPMEGFDNRRLSKFLGLSSRGHEIVMVIAIGKKSPQHIDQPQWRRPIDATVTVL